MNRLENDSPILSASEINRFVYCPYQWYYERRYGRKALRAYYKERNERLGFTDAAQSHFEKGLAFHRDFGRKKGWGRFAAALAVLLALVLLVLLAFLLGWVR